MTLLTTKILPFSTLALFWFLHWKKGWNEISPPLMLGWSSAGFLQLSLCRHWCLGCFRFHPPTTGPHRANGGFGVPAGQPRWKNNISDQRIPDSQLLHKQPQTNRGVQYFLFYLNYRFFLLIENQLVPKKCINKKTAYHPEKKRKIEKRDPKKSDCI